MIIEMIAAALLAAVSVMFILWWAHLKMNNAGLVDVGWAANFTLIAVIYLLLGEGWLVRKLLIAAMAILWSSRLAFYLFVRTVGQEEDARYQSLRAEWGDKIKLKFLLFFLFQGILNVALSVPFLLASAHSAPTVSAPEVVGVGVWLLAVVGESVADRQLQSFKSDPANKGKVCRAGLWKYSRHPNYFFEWLIWVAFTVFALGSPNGYLSLFCPILMLYFLLKVTGIKATEEQAVRSKGEAYRDYQRTTSAFVPWFPKEST